MTWPWPPSRFLAAIVPLAVAAVALAAASAPRVMRVAITAVFALLMTVDVVVAARWIADPARRVGARASDGIVAPWSEYRALFDAVRQRTPPDAVVASVAESMLYLYADRVGVFPYVQDTVRLNYADRPSIGSAADLERRLDAARARYLVRMPAPVWAHVDRLDDAIADLERTRPGRLRSIYRGVDRRFEILAVDPVVAP